MTNTKFLKHISFLFFFLTFKFFFFTPAAFAHVLQTDGSMGAVLHIYPDDDPIIGQPAYFFLEMKDTSNQFNQADCICQVSVLEAGKEVYSQNLFHGINDNPSFYFTFPEKNIYTLKVTGKPIAPASFHSFSLSYDLRVTREVKNRGITVDEFMVLIISGSLILSFIIYTITAKKKSNRKK